MTFRWRLYFAFVCCLMGPSCFAGEFTFHHENVLGTSLELRIKADSNSAAGEAEQCALREIDRLRRIFSSYDSDSELSRFVGLPVGTQTTLSDELFSVLALYEEWNHASNGVLNPATERLTEFWKDAAVQQRKPLPQELVPLTQELGVEHWSLDSATQTATRLSSCPLSLNAIAKGAILDQVVQTVIRSSSQVQGVMLNIGGDLRMAGDLAVSVAIADPRSDAVGGKVLSTLKLSSGAVATSGDSERYLEIEGEKYSHIIDPRTGQPTKSVNSATVLADNASMADALATICAVLPAREGVALVNSLPGAECILMGATGGVFTSTLWPQASNAVAEEDSTGHEMIVNFEIGKPDESRRYRRPYVAVWIEDKDKFPVKTLSLFLMQDNPGPRWYRDVRRWYADDQLRKLVDSRDMIATVSKPTRNPGKYKVKWDGRDDSGKLLEEGKYTLLIEAAREHGTYQLIKQEFEYGKDLKAKLKGNVEIASASVEYTTK